MARLRKSPVMLFLGSFCVRKSRNTSNLAPSCFPLRIVLRKCFTEAVGCLIAQRDVNPFVLGN